MAVTIALGLSDFRQMRAAGLYYADKSHLIRDLLDLPNQAVLFARPRRFGKSAALSLLRAYFERSTEDLAPLFQDLYIWSAGEAYRAHYQRYPVIHMSFKEAKAATWAECERMVLETVASAAAEHRYLLEPGVLHADEAQRLRALIAGQGYDVLVAPRKPGEPGAVLEFKVARDATPRAVGAALKEALAQIERKGYAAQLKARGAAPILCYGVACCGKQLWVRRQGEREPKKSSKGRKKG